MIRFENPVTEGKESGWICKNLITKDLGSDLLLGWITIEKGEGHDYHVHSYGEVIYMLQNSIQFTYRSKDDIDVKSILKEGDTAFIPEGTPHSFWNISDKICNFINIKLPPYFLEHLPLDPKLGKIKLFTNT